MLPVAAQGAESAPVSSSRATATLVSDVETVASGQEFHVALRLRMAPGWHTYWKNPGDAGVAPELKLNVPAGPISWPTPVRQPEGPLMTWGYSGEVLLAVAIRDATAIEADARWLVCNNICVPEEGHFRLTLRRGAATASAEASLFAKTEAQTPRPSPWPVSFAANGTIVVPTAEGVEDAWFAPDLPDVIEPAAKQVFSRLDRGFALGLVPGPAFAKATTLSGVLVVKDQSGQSQGLVVEAEPGAAPEPTTPLWQTLGAALLAGLILNLMPCVFPILALKAAAVTAMSATARRHAVRHALSYMAGIIISFMAVAAALLAARAASGAVGWGFQFQSPIFVAGIAWLLFAVGLNLSGVFLVHGHFSNAGQRLTEQEGLVGQFFTGVLAVVVATPCTAPFMGAAVAAALAAPMPETLLIFATMGVGLAVPFVLVASSHLVCRMLPRPGTWMVLFKQAMAFPMYGACVWMVWVLSQQSGPDGVLAVGAGLVLVGIAAWAIGVRQRGGRRWLLGPAIGSLATLVALLSWLSAAPPPQLAVAEGEEIYSDARLAALRTEGRLVFVNMTAAWCVTCLVNERIALDPESVRRAFAERKVAYLKGDWTRQDAAITAFLRAHGRDGVPLYAVFIPGRNEPELLPQILTPSAVLRAIGAS